jgi:polygalacturonase
MLVGRAGLRIKATHICTNGDRITALTEVKLMNCRWTRLAMMSLIGCTISPGYAALDLPPWPEAADIVAHVRLPLIPDKTFRAAEYGINGDGKTDNTEAFARAIDAVSAAGGGHLIVGPGDYVTGAIRLKSHVDLQLGSGAVIEFSADVTKYPIELTRYQGIDLMNTSPLIGAIGQTDFSITGKGVLDATATEKWNRDGEGNWDALIEMGDSGTPIKDRKFGPAHPLRTTCLEPNNCTNVLIEGITVRGSHFWQIHPLLCDDLIVDGVFTEGRESQTDGCDPESCSNVVIKNCTLGAGDDCIAIKSGRNPDSQRVHKPSENIVIMNCRFHGSRGMIACGSEQTEGIQHIYAYNLSTFDNIPDTRQRTGVRNAFYFKTNSKRGGYIKDIHLDTTTGKFNGAVVEGTLNYFGNGVETGTNYPVVRNIYLSHITDTSATTVLDLTGLYNDPIKNLVISDCAFTNIAEMDSVIYAEAVVYKNTAINGQPAN